MNSIELKLEDRVVIVTGAGKGIGREVAKAFAVCQCKLALITRSEEDIVSLRDELALEDDRIYTMAGDVSSPEVVTRFVDDVYRKFDRIDVLINNAGVRFRKPFLEIELAEWNRVIETNLGSTFLFCQKVGAIMVQQKRGKIVNMASVVGTHGLSELVGYAASKGGILSLTKALAIEWARENIQVNVIAPGFCETSYAEKFRDNEELYNFTLERTPMGRWGRPQDIANACIYLASSLSDYVTGEVHAVDGGWSAW